MATLKSIARSATVAFAPTGSIMAAGTIAGAIDALFNSSASIEILQLDFANTEQELPVLASCSSTEKFNRLSWGKSVVGSEEYALGIIAGSSEDGSIMLWNPAKLTSGDSGSSEDSVVARWRKHEQPVRGLELNGLAPNLLASGGDDGLIYIWDLKEPTNPTHYPVLNDGLPRGEITYVSWNRKVQHILASTSASGTSDVWDLRRAKPVISFTDSGNKRRCSALQWNPENATQLIVASDDNRSPSLKVWDLRNAVSPQKELIGHTKGVLAIAWCPIDSSLLLSCGTDNLTLCWDTLTGEILCEVPARTNWNFDVQWSPRTPGVFSTSSFDGNIGIYNIEACSRMPAHEVGFGHAIRGTDTPEVKKAPKWLKRPVGVSFGFGGKLITFGPTRRIGPGAVANSSEIRLHNLVTEEDLVKQSTEFEKAIADGDRTAMRTFCDLKAETARSEDEQQTWKFLKVMLEDDARKKLLAHLNFGVHPAVSVDREELDQDFGKPEAALPDCAGNLEGDNEESSALVDEIQPGTDAGEDDFFDKIPSPKAAESVPTGGLKDLTLETDEADVDGSQDLETKGEDQEIPDAEEAIQRALVVGDFALAVQHCITADRMADALIIARLGESALWEKTQNAYIRRTGRSYLKIMSSIVNHDLKGLVETRPLKAWKETLALLCTYAPFEDWTQLSDALAARLDAAGEIQAATLCYVCSGNIEKVAEIWSRSLRTINGSKKFVNALQALMEKVVVLSMATGQKCLSASLSRLVRIYAELLVSQGLLATAMEYLSLIPADQSSELSILQDQIYGSLKVSDTKAEAPSAPWQAETPQFEGAVAAQMPQTNYSAPASNASRDYQNYPRSTIPASTFQPPAPAYGASGPSHGGYYPVPAMQPTQGSFVPSAVNPPQVPSVNGFVPMQPPTIPNVDQYQAPAQNQYYPGNTSVPSVQPRVFAPAPPPASFSQVPGPATFNPVSQPLSFSSISQPPAFTPAAGQPQMPNMMLPGPAQPVPAPPTVQSFIPASPRSQQLPPAASVAGTQVQSPQMTSTPAAPPAPPTIQTVDTSNVSAELKPVIVTLTRLFNETSAASGGPRANPAKRREVENNSKRMGALFAKLNAADISANASSKLIQLCQALDAGDYSTALQIQVGLTTSDYDECGFWLPNLKQMIRTRQPLVR